MCCYGFLQFCLILSLVFMVFRCFCMVFHCFSMVFHGFFIVFSRFFQRTGFQRTGNPSVFIVGHRSMNINGFPSMNINGFPSMNSLMVHQCIWSPSFGPLSLGLSLGPSLGPFFWSPWAREVWEVWEP